MVLLSTILIEWSHCGNKYYIATISQLLKSKFWACLQMLHNDSHVWYTMLLSSTVYISCIVKVLPLPVCGLDQPCSY